MLSRRRRGAGIAQVNELNQQIITRRIPNQVGLIGRTFAFQALTDCGAAAQGKAYTNAVQVTLVP